MIRTKVRIEQFDDRLKWFQESATVNRTVVMLFHDLFVTIEKDHVYFILSSASSSFQCQFSTVSSYSWVFPHCAICRFVSDPLFFFCCWLLGLFRSSIACFCSSCHKNISLIIRTCDMFASPVFTYSPLSRLFLWSACSRWKVSSQLPLLSHY